MFHPRTGAVFATLFVVLVVGCVPPAGNDPAETSVDAQSASYRTASPEQYLVAVFARYRNASSYHDRAIVRLSYRTGNGSQSKIAPLDVWLDYNQLYVDAYDVHLGSDANSMMAWVSDETTEDFDSQVLLSPPFQGRPTFERLLSDPILVSRIAAGMAGPPPQLEWLFAPEPMKQLFHDTHQFDFGQSRTVDGRLCRSVRVLAGDDRYEFWIDPQAGVIRRVDLPAVEASPEPGAPLQKMSLTLELTDASFDQPRSRPDAHPLPNHPRFVRRFVPLPPQEPPRILGKRPPSFRLSDSRRQFALSDRGTDREATVVVRFSGDPRSFASVLATQAWHDSMPESLRRRLRVVVLADESALSRLPRELTVPFVIDRRQANSNSLVASSLELAPGGVAILDGRGKLAWTQPLAVPGTMVGLGAVVGDVLEGVDVPARIREQWREQVAEYHRVLDDQSVSRK